METQTPETPRTSCIRCGSCCQAGGPVLHQEDLAVIRSGHASHHHLTTIRKGEPARNPVLGQVLPAVDEIVRVSGQNKSWSCPFYEQGADVGICTIYEHRFLECRTLKCWDPDDILDIFGKDTVRREDLLNPRDPLLDVIALHERECPFSQVEPLVKTICEGGAGMAELTDLVNRDLAVRLYALSELGLDPGLEMFVFGRPVFKSLSTRGFQVFEDKGKVILAWNPES